MGMSANEKNIEERLLRIETALAHLQHDIEDLNRSLTEHFRRLQDFEGRFVRIEHEMLTLTDIPGQIDGDSEKPPHY